MAMQTSLLQFLLLLITLLAQTYSFIAAEHVYTPFNRSSFPKERITDRSNGDVANDFYHHYKEDVKIMKEMNTDAFRFSISWSRILPSLQPFVTLFHWDLPQALEDEYGGFLSPRIVKLMLKAAYRALDFMFGWYMDPIIYGDYPFSMRSIVGQRLPKFTKEQSEMVKGSFDFIGINYYTAQYAANVPVANTVNISYSSDSLANLTTSRNGILIGPQAASSWLHVYPRGFRDLLLYVKEKYNNPLVYITENGLDEFNNATLPLEQALKDPMRIDYYHRHLLFLQRAIKEGVNVKGYFAWSLLDNFEWASGYTVSRRSFPKGFVFGTASAAYQYEGAVKEGGRSPSIWDNFTHTYPERISDGSNGDVAVDFYHRYKEDVKIMKDMNTDALRFSISWSRVLPGGKLERGVNKEGIRFYNNLINKLLANGLQPFVTIFHWDVPQALEDDYGGLLSSRIVFMEPVVYDDYPFTMRKEVGKRLPKFSQKQSMRLKRSFDFIGLNYYTTNYSVNIVPIANSVNISYSTDSHVYTTTERGGIPIGPQAKWIYVYPKGLLDLLTYSKKKYDIPGSVTLLMLPLPQVLKDPMRINYHYRHLLFLQRAIKEGVNVKGYFVWSLLDEFEWASGYTMKFGMNYIDYNNGLKRHPRDSAKWFKNFLKK
ncbi:hypothetical protein Patl1_17274 [Pistacia atlantica]|uniref:Uncharacterized protein n=1 Tax=Pistacia atlantica TaxID=434234 RepID=A0ACC1BBF4_9ROSI|nr:hypothetical protein Patl1_17274 [Pistacia atlantica]